MAEAALAGARRLVESPLDPKFNSDGMYSSHSQGLRAVARNLIKFERWDDLLRADMLPWRDTFHDNMFKTYTETRAYIGKRERFKAEKAFDAHAALAKELEKNKQLERMYKIQAQELKGRLAILRGDTLLGLGLLAEAADDQFEEQAFDNDPPHYPQFLYPELGREYLVAGSPQLAVQAFEKSLKRVRNDLFSLAGLVEAHHALGHTEEARSAMARLLYVGMNADKGLAAIEKAKGIGVTAEPRDSSPAKQRNYVASTLVRYGPALWEPFAAPQLDAIDGMKKRVSLDEYRGKNVILVFYLGRECLHCMKQLQDIAAKSKDWERTETVVLAVSPNKPEDAPSLAGVRILSDEASANARRFQSYDDFEDMEVHSTILIDKKGRVQWGHTGGEPFGDIAFLSKQIDRMNKVTP
jgi:peroxiredoxin